MFISKRTLLARKGSAALLILALASPALATPRRPPESAQRRPFRSNEQTAPRELQFEALSLERSRQNHLLVRAFINGKPALLSVDTGAPISIIAMDRVAHFAMTPVRANSEIPTRLRVNGSFSSVAVARSLQLGILNLVDEPMVVVDLQSTSTAAKLMKEQAIDGIIGADILFPTNAVLDCRAQRLILKLDPKVHNGVPGMDYRGFSKVRIHVSDGSGLYVDGRLNGKRAKLRVDNGAFGTVLHQPFVKQMKIPLRASHITFAAVKLKQHDFQLATISQFHVGSVDMRRKEVGVIDLEGLVEDGMLDATPPAVGLLGSEILQHHYAIIDFGTRTLYLKR